MVRKIKQKDVNILKLYIYLQGNENYKGSEFPNFAFENSNWLWNEKKKIRYKTTGAKNIYKIIYR